MGGNATIKPALRIKHKLTTALVVLFIIGFITTFLVLKTDYRLMSYAPFRKVEKGQTEARVVELLGPPDTVRKIDDPYDISYKLKGFTFRPFLATGTVFVYQRQKSACYILLRDGRVVDLTIGNK